MTGTGYHVTTLKKLSKYEASRCILPPVRFFPSLLTAERWAKRTGREIILSFEYDSSWPLPDHKPARWTDEVVRSWKICERE
jgi:hypothetical protein